MIDDKELPGLFGPLFSLRFLERCIELEDVCKEALAAIKTNDVNLLEGLLSLPKSTTLVNYLMKRLGIKDSLVDALICSRTTNGLQLPLPVLLNDLEFIHLQLELEADIDQREEYEVIFPISNSSAADESLDHYVKVGKMMKSSTEVQELKNVLCTPVALGRYCTFGVICESSGTGKTQIPFSLDVPYLYFLYSIQCKQQIYDNFYNHSDELMTLLVEDSKIYFEKFTMDSDKILEARVEQVSKSPTPFKVVGFIVSMLRKVVEEFIDCKGAKHSALIQTKLKSIKYRPMTVSEGRLAIQKLLKNVPDQSSFPIFFDECAFQKSYVHAMPAQFSEELNFMLLRSLVRSMLCHPIFMGTNAEAANFLGITKGQGSGDTKTGSAKEPWCVIIHRLPAYEEGMYREAFSRMRTKLSSKTPRPQFPNDELISFLERHLSRERPIFTYYLESFLDEFISSNEVVTNNYEFFGLLLESICVRFRDRKRNIEWMNLGQMAYMCARTWGIVNPSAERKASNILSSRTSKKSFGKMAQEGLIASGKIFHSDLYIHNHFGILDAIPDKPDNPFYTTISSKAIEKMYLREYFMYNGDFKIASTFPIFTHSPILGFVCTGLDSKNQSILVEKVFGNIGDFPIIDRKRTLVASSNDRVERTSVCRALWSCIEPVNTSIARKASATSGFVLELALYCAALLASRANGLLGCDLLTFLRHLVRELNFTPSYDSEDDLSEIILHPDFKKSFREFKVPFISPMATDTWNSAFVDDLKKSLSLDDLCLGVGIPSISQSPADFIVKNWPGNEIVMCGECKLYKDAINASTLRSRIVSKFANYPSCNLFLAVAPYLADIEEFFDERYCIWCFEWHEGKLIQRAIKTKKPQPTKAKKHVVFLDLATLYTGTGNFDTYIDCLFKA